MNAKQLIATLKSNAYTVKCKFKSHDGEAVGKAYTYMTDIAGLEVGQEVVVDAPQTGMTVVVVTAVDKILKLDANAPFEYKWVVCAIDTKAHELRMEKEEELIAELEILQAKAAKVKLVEELKAKLGFEGECEELNALIAKING